MRVTSIDLQMNLRDVTSIGVCLGRAGLIDRCLALFRTRAVTDQLWRDCNNNTFGLTCTFTYTPSSPNSQLYLHSRIPLSRQLWHLSKHTIWVPRQVYVHC